VKKVNVKRDDGDFDNYNNTEEEEEEEEEGGVTTCTVGTSHVTMQLKLEDRTLWV